MSIQVLDFSEANCKNCYKCVRKCKLKAIRVKDNQAKIERDLCIACGECFLVCSQNARKIHSDLSKLNNYVKNNEKIIITIAPSYRAYFSEHKKILGLLKQIGVYRIEETGVAASFISKGYQDHIDKGENNIYITSACASINTLVEKYYPEYQDYLLPITTPLLLHGKLLKKEYPDSKVVFVGPCLSKKTEILSMDNEGIIDAVLTFDELMEEYGNYRKYPEAELDKEASFNGKSFPKIGGISDFLKLNNYKNIAVQGVQDSIDFFNSLDKIKDNKLFIEINACKGGCLNGPAGQKTNTTYFERVLNIEKNVDENFEYKNDCSLERSFYNKQIKQNKISEEEVNKVLFSMEKYTKKDELNCAACGYNSCREKAIAVINDMSTIDMCIPFMRTKAERITNELFENSPNGVLILDSNLMITNLNSAAKEKFYFDKNSVGCKITDFMVDDDFQHVLDTKENIIKKREFYSKYDLIAQKNIIYLENQRALLVIITNITKEETQKKELSTMKTSTLELTQDVIKKQMRVAQEIASLLGETTAETKVALTKLKNLVEGEF